MIAGVHKIKHQSGRSYLGSAVNVRKRWGNHKSDLRRGVHHNRGLQAAWDRDGEGAFEFILLKQCSREERHEWEQHYLDKTKNLYNHCPTAGGTTGLKMTKASLRKRGRRGSHQDQKRAYGSSNCATPTSDDGDSERE